MLDFFSSAHRYFRQVWVAARADNDWAKFAPMLKQLVALAKEKAKHIDPHRVRELPVCR